MNGREILDHKVNGLNEAIKVTAVDQPGPGGANHKYLLDLVGGAPGSGGFQMMIEFQNGPVKESGFNGFSNEALVAVVIDRMRGFQYGRKNEGEFDESQRGKYACRENALALTALEEALMWLQKRTRDRMARNVEGTHAV